jgi:hypothetical protein
MDFPSFHSLDNSMQAFLRKVASYNAMPNSDEKEVERLNIAFGFRHLIEGLLQENRMPNAMSLYTMSCDMNIWRAEVPVMGPRSKITTYHARVTSLFREYASQHPNSRHTI